MASKKFEELMGLADSATRGGSSYSQNKRNPSYYPEQEEEEEKSSVFDQLMQAAYKATSGKGFTTDDNGNVSYQMWQPDAVLKKPRYEAGTNINDSASAVEQGKPQQRTQPTSNYNPFAFFGMGDTALDAEQGRALMDEAGRKYDSRVSREQAQYEEERQQAYDLLDNSRRAFAPRVTAQTAQEEAQDWLANSQYADYMKQGDYAALSKAGESKASWAPWKNDIVYDYINDINGTREQQDMLTRAGENGAGYQKYSYMTDDQIGVYNYIYATQGKKAAKKYLKDLDPALNKQKYAAASKFQQEQALEHPFLYDAATVAAAPARAITGALASAQDAWRTFTDQEIDPYSELRQLNLMTRDVRQARAENPGLLDDILKRNAQAEIQGAAANYDLYGSGENNPFENVEVTGDEVRGASAFIYQTVMSALDSTVNMAMAGGIAGSLPLQSTDAVMQATNVIGSLAMSSEVTALGIAESKEKGYSDGAALGIGLIRGAIEYASEAMGGEWVIKNIKNNPLNFVKTMIMNMVPEGVEEVMSDAMNGTINLLLDQVLGTQESGLPDLMGEFSQPGWQTNHPAIAAIMDAVGSDSPELATVLSLLGDEALSFLGGALATVGTTGVQSYNMNRNINATGQRLGVTPEDVVQLMENYQTESPADIYNMAEELGAENVEQLRQKTGEGRSAGQVLEDIQQSDEANKEKYQIIADTFRKTGVELKNAEIRQLADDMDLGEADQETFLLAAKDAYKMGASGNFSLGEAIRASDAAASLTDTQFRHAFELGQKKAGVKAQEATGSVQERLDASLAMLGENASQAAQVYQEGQDIDTYAEAMYKASALYAANGQDVHAIAEQARSGERADIVGRLTDAQLDTAIQIGQRMAAESAQKVQQATERYAALREQAAKLAAEGKTPTGRKGSFTLATEGGRVEGKRYTAVDESKLSKRQKDTVAAVQTVTELLGLDVTVVSGAGNWGGAYFNGGRIVLNINSGMNLRNFSKSIAAGSFAHEMTHWLQEYARDEYDALKKITTGHLSAEQLDKLVQEQLKSQPNLSPDEALDEVIANACQPLLKDSKAFEQLARQNMTLAEKILDFLKEFTQKIRDAFGDIDFKDDLPIYHAVQAVEGHLDEMQAAFDKAILAARENMAAERAVQETEQSDAVQEVKYQIWDAENKTHSGNMPMTEDDLPSYMKVGVREHVRHSKENIVAAGDSPILHSREETAAFIGDSMDRKIKDTIKVYGKVGDAYAEDLLDVTKGLLDAHGAYLEIDSNRMAHSDDHAEFDNDPRNIPLSRYQMEHINEYADDYDEILQVLMRRDGSVRIFTSKAIPGGNVVVVELASTGRSSIQPVTGWQNTEQSFKDIWGNKKRVLSTSPLTKPVKLSGYIGTLNNKIAETEEKVKSDPRVAKGTENKLQEIGSTATDGVVVSDDMAALMQAQGFSKPVDPVEQLSAKYQVWTTDDWERNYLTAGGDLTVAAQIRDFTNAMIADDAIMGYVPAGHYQKSRFGPLRKNIEYRWTFDMDASCPRTFQFVNYRNALQSIAGRPLTDGEAMNLLYLMRRMNQQIPCTYCYVENKRVMKSKSYLDWFQSRADVMSAVTDEEALKKMYSYDPKKGTVGTAAQKVFDEWRADVKAGKAYYPTAQEVWTGLNTAKNTVFNFLDKGLENGVIRFGEGVKKATTQKKMVDAVCKRFGVTDKAARREIEGFVAKWRYDVLAGTKHVYDVVNDTSVDTINQDILRLNRLASNYASSVSQARLVDDYIPYTDQLKNVPKADKEYIMGMGGIRKHSSNDFRMDYVQDYFLFYADLAAGGWTGHTYTKSVDYCKVFGRTGDRINLSIAMNTENGKIVENQQEGAAWKDARELRKAYKDVGVMAMVTDNAQLSFALNNDWIDMCIPFHASGLPKAVWYNLRAWSDYTSVQLESYFNSTEMKERLTAAKVNVKGLNSEEIEALYNSTFNVPLVRNQNGQRVKPHFFPNDTTIYGPGGVAQVIPGHHNDAKRYFELCEQYGVHPRFYGTQVTDANGKVIDVTEHPNYVKLIKETSRTDTEQEPIRFNFNEKDDYLGMSPFEYAMQRMQEEAKIGGYKSTAKDPMGIVPMFEELYLGKNREIGWLPVSQEEGDAADKLLTTIEYTKNAYKEMYDADVQTLDTTGYQKVLTEQTSTKAKLQTWDEGAVYNDRALVSEETLDKWMSSQWFGSSNPDYAQAFITSMSPSQFLKLTTVYDESRIREESKNYPMDAVREASERQPIQLMIDTETGQVVGHEGRHRMAALERNGVYEVPVLLFDSSNKYSKKPMKELRLLGQNFNGQHNISRSTVFDVYPLNRNHRQQIVNLYSKQTYSEGFKERYNGAQTVRFQQWDDTGDDTAREKRGREGAYARLQSENAILRQTVKELKRLSGKQTTTLANIQKQLQLTKTPETRLSDAAKLARSLLHEYSSTADTNTVAEAIKAVGDYLLNTSTDQITEEELKSRARAAAMEILDNASETMTFDDVSLQVNPYDAYIGEASEDLANRIVMDAMEGVLRPTAPTKADKQQARTQALRDRIQELKNEQKLSQREAASLYQTIYDLSLQLDRQQSRYESLRQTANRRISQVRAEGSARAAEVQARERARADNLLEEQKQHYLDIAKRARERRENTVSRSKIRKLIDDLNRRLAKPTEKKYVPQELIRLTVDVLSVIDTDSGRGGEKLAQKLERIRTMYDSYKQDPKYSAVYDEVAAQMLQDMCVKIGDTGLYKMGPEQLETVYKTLKALTHIIDNAVKVKIGTEERNAFEVSNEMTQETRQIPKAQKGWLKQHWIPAGLRPDVAFHRFGGFKKNSAWDHVVRMLNDGQLKQTDITMKLSLPFAELINNAAAMRDFTGVNFFNHVDPSKLIDIGLKDADGKPIKVTHDIAVGIYMDLLNEDNRRHFIRGGKTIPNMRDYYTGRGGFGMGTTRAMGISTELSDLMHQQREAKAEGDISLVEDLQAQIDDLIESGESYADTVQKNIEKQLTDFDKQWIELTQQLMDKEGKRYLNETTMDVYGIEKATVDHYYPITSDPNYLASSFESITKDMNLENVGFMKERVQSGNPTLAMGVSSVVNNQIQRVAQYAGLMPAIRNFNKIWSKQAFGYSDSLKNAVNDVFGKEGGQYVENLIADLTGSRGVGDDSLGLNRLMGRLRGNLAQTTLTLNIRVALAQAASYPTAAAEVGAKALTKAFFRGGRSNRMISRADQELIAKYSPLLYHRMQGYSSVELGDIKNSQRLSSRLWKKARWATGWIQAVDGATVGRLWYAAEYWVQDNMPSLEKGTDEYYQAVAQKFNDVVEKTQPNYTTMQRPQILRDPNEMVKMLTMFMTQRLQNFNILYDAAGSYQKARADKANSRNGVTQADVAEAKDDLVRAVSSQLAQGAVYVGFKLLADALLRNMKAYRDDDDGRLTAESISMQLLDNYIDAMAGMFIGGSEIYSILKAVTGHSKWYGLSLSGVDSVNDLMDDIVKLSTTDSSDSAKFNKQLSKTALSLCQALGIPANNAIKIKDAILNTITDTANGNFWSFDAGYEVTKEQQKLRDLEALGFTKEEAQALQKEADANGKGGISQEEMYNYIQTHDLTDEQILGLWATGGWSTDYATYNARQEKKAANAAAQEPTAAPEEATVAPEATATPKPTEAPTEAPKPAQSTGISTWEQFQKVVPVYSDKRQATYEVWEQELKPAGMTLDQYYRFLSSADTSGNNSLTQDEMGYALRDAVNSGTMTDAQAESVWNSQGWSGKHNYTWWKKKHK